MGKIPNLPAQRADSFESAGKMYGKTKSNGSWGANFDGGYAASAIATDNLHGCNARLEGFMKCWITHASAKVKNFTALTIFLFLPQYLHAYELSLTKLADNNFQPVPAAAVEIYGELANRKYDPDEQEVAVLTLQFGPNEIGQDHGAVKLIAKKEAAKLGGTRIFYVSGTSWKNTDTTADVTFRVVRAEEDVEKHAAAEKQAAVQKLWMKKIIEVEFGKKYVEFFLTPEIQNLFVNFQALMHGECVADFGKEFGVKCEAVILKSGGKDVVFADAKTGKTIPDKDIELRFDSYVRDLWENFKKGKKDQYIKDYISLRKIDDKFLAKYPDFELQGWPDPAQYDSWNFFDDKQKLVNSVSDNKTPTEDSSAPGILTVP